MTTVPVRPRDDAGAPLGPGRVGGFDEGESEEAVADLVTPPALRATWSWANPLVLLRGVTEQAPETVNWEAAQATARVVGPDERRAAHGHRQPRHRSTGCSPAGPTSTSSWCTARDRRGPHLLTSALAGLLPGGHERLGAGRDVDLLGHEHRHRPHLRRHGGARPARGPARARDHRPARRRRAPRGRRPRPAAGPRPARAHPVRRGRLPPGRRPPRPALLRATRTSDARRLGPYRDPGARPPPWSPCEAEPLHGPARPGPALRGRARRDRPRAPRARHRRRPQPAGAGRDRHLAHGVRRSGRPEDRACRRCARAATQIPEDRTSELWRAAGFEVTGVRTQRVSADPEDPESDSVLLQQHVVRPVLGIDESPPRLRWTIDTAAPGRSPRRALG